MQLLYYYLNNNHYYTNYYNNSVQKQCSQRKPADIKEESNLHKKSGQFHRSPTDQYDHYQST